MKNRNNSIIFGVLLVVIIFSLHAILILGLKRVDSGDFGVWNRLIDGRINTKVLLVGSSRTLVHFDCDTLRSTTGQSCFNIGLDGAHLNFQVPYLQTYLKHNEPPQVIIQGVDLISLETDTGIYKPEQYVPYLDQPEIYSNLLTVDPDFWRHKYLPLYSFATFGVTLTEWAIIGLLNLKGKEHRRLGFWSVDRDWTDDFQRFKARFPSGKTYPIDKQAISNLKKIIEICQSRNIRIILVYTPEYYENYALTLNRNEMFAVFKSVADKYNVPFWDYSDIPLTHKRELFYNSQHLNSAGAARFSSIFAHDLKQYLDNPVAQ